jgi:hypothetical protein
VRNLEALRAAEPKNMRWRYELADSLSFQSGILSITGELAAAKDRLREGTALAEELVAHDASNRDWQSVSVRLRLRYAALLVAERQFDDAARVVAGVRAELERTGESSLTAGNRAHLATAWRLEAEMQGRTGGQAAAAAVSRALALNERAATAPNPSLVAIADFARSCVLAASLAARNGDARESRRHATRALELLEPRMKGSNDWRLLDPAARALALLDRGRESREIISRLEKFGYRPPTPWSSAEPATLSVRNP